MARKLAEPVARRVGGVAAERRHDEPPHATPIALRSAQHVTVSKGRFEPSWSRRMVLVQWVVTGGAAMEVAGERMPYAPGQVAIFLPTIPLRFWAVADVSEMCWFTVDGSLAEEFVIDLDLKPGVFPFPAPPPVPRIEQMITSLADDTIRGRRRSSLLAIELLYDVATAIRVADTPSVVQRAQQIVQQEFADPDLSTEAIARRLFYHRGSLSRLFHRHTGITLIEYISQVRLREARALLQHSSEKIATVAHKCGFRESSYFCRWIRKRSGKSPAELRAAPSLL